VIIIAVQPGFISTYSANNQLKRPLLGHAAGDLRPAAGRGIQSGHSLIAGSQLSGSGIIPVWRWYGGKLNAESEPVFGAAKW